MDKRFLVTVFALAMVVAGAGAFASIPKKVEPETATLHEPVSGIEEEYDVPKSESHAESGTEYTYILKEHNGHVAVFLYENPSEPEIVLDTLVKFLPDYDRTQMMDGIPVKDYKELLILIEDYIS